MSSILVVCTGNICRSPVGEAVLKAQLTGAVTVSSAGTHAAVGQAASPEAIEYVERKLGLALDHVAQQLTKQRAEASDLIVTMTTEHRAWVARAAPRTVRRTFTLREIEQILAQLPQHGAPQSLGQLVLSASTLRTGVFTGNEEIGIPDPYGGPPDAYDESFQQVLTASTRLAASLNALTSMP